MCEKQEKELAEAKRLLCAATAVICNYNRVPSFARVDLVEAIDIFVGIRPPESKGVYPWPPTNFCDVVDPQTDEPVKCGVCDQPLLLWHDDNSDVAIFRCGCGDSFCG